jgi:hypothetical protein
VHFVTKVSLLQLQCQPALLYFTVPISTHSTQIIYKWGFFSLCTAKLYSALFFWFSTSIFSQTTSPGPLIHGLKPFWIQLRIREDIRQSCLHSGVKYTTVHVTAVSLIPLFNQLCLISSRMIRNTRLTRLHTAAQCHSYRCNIHSGVIDTAVTCTCNDTAVQWHRCDFVPHIPSALASFKGNIYRKKT